MERLYLLAKGLGSSGILKGRMAISSEFVRLNFLLPSTDPAPFQMLSGVGGSKARFGCCRDCRGNRKESVKLSNHLLPKELSRSYSLSKCNPKLNPLPALEQIVLHHFKKKELKFKKLKGILGFKLMSHFLHIGILSFTRNSHQRHEAISPTFCAWCVIHKILQKIHNYGQNV